MIFYVYIIPFFLAILYRIIPLKTENIPNVWCIFHIMNAYNTSFWLLKKKKQPLLRLQVFGYLAFRHSLIFSLITQQAPVIIIPDNPTIRSGALKCLIGPKGSLLIMSPRIRNNAESIPPSRYEIIDQLYICRKNLSAKVSCFTFFTSSHNQPNIR